MLLSELCQDAGLGDAGSVACDTAGDTAISGITQDSQKVKSGDLFCCVKGMRHDGHKFAKVAVAKGAAALLCERSLDLGVPEIICEDSRSALGKLASAYNGHPSREIDVIGITGTNGKTTTVAMLASILRAAGRRVRTIGTLSGSLTTPEPTLLQAEFAEAAEEAGATSRTQQAVVMEVSSHGLSQRRLDGTKFAICAFTNLSQDHLDYHFTMEGYFQAKQLLFQPEFCSKAVINTDTPYGRRLIREMPADIAVRSCGMSEAEDVQVSLSGTRFVWQGLDISLQLIGDVAVENAITAAAIAQEMGVAAEQIVTGLEGVNKVAGRLEIVSHQPVAVVVDYAHTPEALSRVLKTCTELVGPAGGRVFAVFGCGGDRDKAKREQMGKAADSLSDFIVITNDNPRSEDPQSIASEVIKGIAKTPFIVELDRKAAIGLALENAKEGDLVLIAGKGHETTQHIGADVLEFNDREVAMELLGVQNSKESIT